MTSRDDQGWWSIAIALVFSLYYLHLYPILVGGFVIYARPSWPRQWAAAYVLSGILMQAWFSFGPKRPLRSLWPQGVTSAVYAVAPHLISGIYQS